MGPRAIATAAATAIALTATGAAASEFYSGDSKVRNLGVDTFDAEVTRFPGLAVVEFYAPWCGHCKNLAPAWNLAAAALSSASADGIRLGAVDVTQSRELGTKYDVSGFPTIKVFAADKEKPAEYEGPRDAAGIVAAVVDEARKMAFARAGLEVPKKKAEKKSADSGVGFYDGSDVGVLTDDSWATEVEGGSEGWLVEFYAPWCGHCKNLAPTWKQAATALLGGIRVGAVDVTEQKALGEKFGVKSFPTLMFFAPAKTGEAAPEPEAYEGGRSLEDLVAFGRAKAELFPGPPIEVPQIAGQAALEEACGTAAGAAAGAERAMCVLLIVPHVIDTGAAGRRRLIDVAGAAAGRLRSRKLGFGWICGGEHDALEQQLNVVASYPVLVAFDAARKQVHVHRGALEPAAIAESLKRVVDTRRGLRALRGGSVKLAEGVPLWDGKDYVAVDDE